MDEHGAERFETFVDALAAVIGHADRVRPLRDYCTRRRCVLSCVCDAVRLRSFDQTYQTESSASQQALVAASKIGASFAGSALSR